MKYSGSETVFQLFISQKAEGIGSLVLLSQHCLNQRHFEVIDARMIGYREGIIVKSLQGCSRTCASATLSHRVKVDLQQEVDPIKWRSHAATFD